MSEANLQGADQTFQLFWDGCAHLQVWDGSRCSHTLLKVNISPDEHHVTEGPTSFSARKEQLIANVLVYDNHVELARHLKVRHTHTHTHAVLNVLLLTPVFPELNSKISDFFDVQRRLVSLIFLL